MWTSLPVQRTRQSNLGVDELLAAFAPVAEIKRLIDEVGRGIPFICVPIWRIWTLSPLTRIG